MEKAPFDVVTLATPAFILLIILEMVLGKLDPKRASYEPRDTFASLTMGLGSQVFGAVTAGIVAATTVAVWRHRLFDISMTSPVAWIAIFFLEDLIYYWFHRLSHERRFWWAAHVNHHSSQHYNLSTALRQTWTGGVNGSWCLWLLLAFLGFPPAMIFVEKGVSLVYQFWIHTEAIKRFPSPLEAVMNTPSHHRVHHARNPRYLDRNYAGILIIWDKLFGTFEPERDDEPCDYGVVKNLGGFNVFRIALHEWEAMARDLLQAKSLSEVWAYVFGPPGWSPDGSRKTSKDLKAAWQSRLNSPEGSAGSTP